MKFIIKQRKRKWFHVLLGVKKPRPIQDLTANDFEIKSFITILEEHENGEYLFTIENDIQVKKEGLEDIYLLMQSE